MKHPPIKGEFFLYRDRIYKAINVSSGTDQVFLEDIETKKQYEVRYALFMKSYERVFRIKTVANWLNRSQRSVYRYENQGLVKKPKMYPISPTKQVRFYRLDDVFEMHQMISQLHQGRPRKDGRVINNTLPDLGTLKINLKERYG